MSVQVGAPGLGVVGHQHVPGLQLALVQLVLVLDGVTHGAQMDGYMRGVGDEIARWAEESAREVEAFLDVKRDRGLLQRATHLFGNGHEAVPEDGELDVVDFLGGSDGGLLDGGDLDQHVGWEDLGRCSWGHDESLRLVDDDGGAWDQSAWRELLELVDWG
ncbi:hypothetical protein KEM55_002809 [Ascosphaera atra]|nr:hypothetical protein KEM55_002809 [Ascosphaera atra]